MSDQEKEKFWQSLQDEWEEMAKEDRLHEHPWLSEFSSSVLEPFKVEYTHKLEVCFEIVVIDTQANLFSGCVMCFIVSFVFLTDCYKL